MGTIPKSSCVSFTQEKEAWGTGLIRLSGVV